MVTLFKGEKWAISYQLCICPANPIHAAIFPASILEFKGSHHSARTAQSIAHKVAGLEPPSNHPLVKSIVDAGYLIGFTVSLLLRKNLLRPNYIEFFCIWYNCKLQL